MGAVYKDVLLEVGGGAVADFFEAFLVVFDFFVGGVGEDGHDDWGVLDMWERGGDISHMFLG